jgi:hypothetical protein
MGRVDRTLTVLPRLRPVDHLLGRRGTEQLEMDSGSDWLNWIIPIVLVVGAFRFTAVSTTDHSR